MLELKSKYFRRFRLHKDHISRQGTILVFLGNFILNHINTIRIQTYYFFIIKYIAGKISRYQAKLLIIQPLPFSPFTPYNIEYKFEQILLLLKAQDFKKVICKRILVFFVEFNVSLLKTVLDVLVDFLDYKTTYFVLEFVPYNSVQTLY